MPVQVATSAEQWIVDRDWKMKANPIAAQAQHDRDALDKKILEKRRAGRILKNMALEQ